MREWCSVVLKVRLVQNFHFLDKLQTKNDFKHVKLVTVELVIGIVVDSIVVFVSIAIVEGSIVVLSFFSVLAMVALFAVVVKISAFVGLVAAKNCIFIGSVPTLLKAMYRKFVAIDSVSLFFLFELNEVPMAL